MNEGALKVEPGTELAPMVDLGVIHANTPAELVQRATEAANALSKVIRDRKLFSNIQGKEFVRCEGWTSLAAMMGFIPRETANVRREDGSYEATVELVRVADGLALTRATAECGTDEPSWAKRAAYARRSMAATRATSKACRQAFSWVMALTGFQVTPAEEVPPEGFEPASKQPLSEMPAALEEDDVGDVLESKPLSDLLLEVAKSGVKKAEFPKWYERVVGREYNGWIYEGDVTAIKAEVSKLMARKGAKP